MRIAGRCGACSLFRQFGSHAETKSNRVIARINGTRSRGGRGSSRSRRSGRLVIRRSRGSRRGRSGRTRLSRRRRGSRSSRSSSRRRSSIRSRTCGRSRASGRGGSTPGER